MIKYKILQINFLELKIEKIKSLEPEPPYYVLSCSRCRPSWVKAEVGSETLGFRSRTGPKKWRLRNTGISCVRPFRVTTASVTNPIKNNSDPEAAFLVRQNLTLLA